MSSSNCERYEKYKFNATEDDHLVCNILLGLENLIRKSDPSPSPLTWATKRRRSALNSSSSPAPHPINNKQRLHSPSSPLGYSPNEAHNLHHSKTKTKKKKLKDWEEHVEKLKQTKQQLILTLDNVKNYQRTVLEFNLKLKAKRDELNGHIPKQSNVKLNVQTQQLQHQFPIFAQHQKPLEYTIQPSMTLYYPAPFFPSNNGGGMRIIDGYRRLDDKALRAADARKRRRLQINEKKNSIGIRRRLN